MRCRCEPPASRSRPPVTSDDIDLCAPIDGVQNFSEKKAKKIKQPYCY
uniref:Uncharacterized protein n=1 Tax=Arundo donax TaxID=35708 RepID=A0A0A9L655_ARUDO